jgi:hypothetical protein
MTTTKTLTTIDSGPPQRYEAGEDLRVITLLQPWASLMAWGEKEVETRPRRWRFRGWWAIHAGANATAARQADVANESHMTRAFEAHGVAPWDAPRGCILAVVRVWLGLPTECANVSEKERAFGDYTPGRWCYLTADRHELKTPIDWKGAQGIPHAPLALRQKIAKALRS